MQVLSFPPQQRHSGGRGLRRDAIGKEEEGEVSLEAGPASGGTRQADTSLGAVTTP